MKYLNYSDVKTKTIDRSLVDADQLSVLGNPPPLPQFSKIIKVMRVNKLVFLIDRRSVGFKCPFLIIRFSECFVYMYLSILSS